MYKKLTSNNKIKQYLDKGNLIDMIKYRVSYIVGPYPLHHISI